MSIISCLIPSQAALGAIGLDGWDLPGNDVHATLCYYRQYCTIAALSHPQSSRSKNKSSCGRRCISGLKIASFSFEVRDGGDRRRRRKMNSSELKSESGRRRADMFRSCLLKNENNEAHSEVCGRRDDPAHLGFRVRPDI